MNVMICSVHRRLLTGGLSAVLCAASVVNQSAIAANAVQDNPPQTAVTLRWGMRPGVLRYRLQLAKDAGFADIVFDRVVSGHEYRLNDLQSGRYYWRVASLNAKRGQFSSAGVIEVPAVGSTKPGRPTVSQRNDAAVPPSAISPGGGWYAAIGNVAKSVVAHLKSPRSSEIVAATTDGRLTALDATNGVALWTIRLRVPTQRASSPAIPQPVAVRGRNSVDNVLVFVTNLALLIDGRTGRELWRTTLPSKATAAVAVGTNAFVIDNSIRKLIAFDANTGKVLSEANLPRRAVGAPLLMNYHGRSGVMVVLEDGRLQIFDDSGKLIGSGNAGSPATTAPLLVRTARGELVLVGTRTGLTALAADELRPLGRLTFQGDAPYGTLTAQDLDGDGRPEVVMFTERGRVMVIKSDEGKILWQADAHRAESTAFADVNGDHVLDLLMAAREGFAFALSGKDGSMIWKEETRSNVAANHAPAPSSRSMLVVSLNSSVLMIAPDPERGGLRAIEFPKR